MWAFLLPLCSFSAEFFDKLGITSYRNLTLAFDYRRKLMAPGQLLSFSQTTLHRNIGIKGLFVHRSPISLITSYSGVPNSLSLHKCVFDSFLAAPIVFTSKQLQTPLKNQNIKDVIISSSSRSQTECPATFEVYGCTFQNCQAVRDSNNEFDRSGGALYLRGVVDSASQTFKSFRADIQHTSFIQCKAGATGGAIYAEGDSTIRIADCMFSQCESATLSKYVSTGYAAAICDKNGASLIIEYSKFIENKANENMYASIIDVSLVKQVTIQHISVIGSVFKLGVTESTADIMVTGISTGLQSPDIYANLIDICFLNSKSTQSNVYNIYLGISGSTAVTNFRVEKCNFDRKSGVVGTSRDLQYAFIDFRLGTDYDMCPYRPTSAFTETVAFSGTNGFTETGPFKNSEALSQSKAFDPSAHFSATSAFKETGAFSQSVYFSPSETHSDSESLSESDSEAETESDSMEPTDTASASQSESASASESESETMSDSSMVLPPPSATEDPGLALGIIIGIAVGGALLLVIIIVIVILCVRKRAVAFKEPESDPLDEGLYEIPHEH